MEKFRWRRGNRNTSDNVGRKDRQKKDKYREPKNKTKKTSMNGRKPTHQMVET